VKKKTLRLSGEEIDTAAKFLSSGGLVALPTETVYGLAADSTNEQAVAEIYRAKGRADSKPLSVLVTDMEMVARVCRDIPPMAYRLADVFWPGPLTMILHGAGFVAPIVTAGGESLGVRCPDHALTLELIRRVGKPLAAPSANISGEASPKDADAVFGGLDGKIDAVLDGGVCTVAIESTILDLTGETPKILRHGGLAEMEIWTLLREEGLL